MKTLVAMLLFCSLTFGLTAGTLSSNSGILTYGIHHPFKKKEVHQRSHTIRREMKSEKGRR